MRAKNNVQTGVSSRAGAKILRHVAALCFFVASLGALGLAMAQDDWSQLEQEMVLEQKALEANEGELRLLEHPPQVASHFHHTRLIIDAQSLRDGWLTMYQCHSDLDKVSSSQIVYQPKRIDNIRVMSSRNIDAAWVEEHTVQMRGIAAESEICISAERRALEFENGVYYLRLGPFVRRFLDGYYPMHVRVEVSYPDYLRLVSSSPVKALVHTKLNFKTADIDVWVVGELNVEFSFAEAPVYQ